MAKYLVDSKAGKFFGESRDQAVCLVVWNSYRGTSWSKMVHFGRRDREEHSAWGRGDGKISATRMLFLQYKSFCIFL